MQVFKTYFKIMKKRLVPLILYGAMFLGITIIITMAIFRDNSKKFSAMKVPAVVVNEDRGSSFTDSFLTYLGRYVSYEEIGNTEADRKDALFSRKVSYILTIPEGFTEELLAGKDVMLTKQTIPDSMDTVAVDTAIDIYLNAAKLYMKYNAGSSIEELNTNIERTMQEDTPVTLEVKDKKVNLNAGEFNKYFFNYLGYILITCFILGVSTVMLSFQGLDIRRKHSASPITTRSYTAQLILANLVFVLCYLVVFPIAGYICNPYRTFDLGMVLIWINVLLFSLTVLSISYLIGITVKSRNSVQALSTMLSLALAFLSGMFVPQDFLGEPVLKVASFTPAYWYVKVNNTIAGFTEYSLKNLSEIAGYMAIQLGFTAAIITIVMVVSKRKSQQAY
jgi:ABC-2 type transport system permease protein